MRPIKDVPLSEIVTFISGGTPSRRVPSYFEGDVPWITGADIDQLGKITPRFSITEEAIQSSATSIVIPGTVLLVTRTNIGKATVADRDICFSQDITALHPDAKQVDTRYLLHFLRSQQKHLTSNARGATIKGVAREVLANLQMPLPLLEEQRRIAGSLDRADELRAKRWQALAHLDDLAPSIFDRLFGDPATTHGVGHELL